MMNEDGRPGPGLRLKYPSALRLGGKLQFSSVFDARVRQSRGFLTAYGKPNQLPYSRFGISISRKVGVAPKRNRIKRLLREAFRLGRHELPGGFDWVVVVRPHETAGLGEYQALLAALTAKLCREWERRDVPPPPVTP